MHQPSGLLRVGVDIGGTFSDFVILGETTGEIRVVKVPSTPSDPSDAIVAGLRRLRAEGLEPESVTFFAHGTTVATNALLEGKGARAGLLITRGFRAVQDVQDQTRGIGPSIYDFGWEKPRPLVPQERTGEVRERMDFRGEVLTPLDEEAARREVRRLLDLGVESFAVCLLFSFMNSAHERALGALIAREAPEARVSLSSDILPVIREWNRLSTTQVNAYVAPRLYGYLRHMEERLTEQGVATEQRFVMQSNGGMASFRHAADRAVTTILSGPAAGVIAGARLAEASGFPACITFDIGGTSTDIALVEGGEAVETTTGSIAGYPVGLPMLDINTISAGGGTLAWVDDVGTLRCGPASAGAVPGPACYGAGGTRPTITDANLVLGYLDPDFFLGGEISLDRGAAERAIEEHVARPLGLSIEEAAAGIVRLIDVQMADGVRAVSSERGYDVRDFAIVAFGGAGPLHASQIARELGIPTVLVPRYPGLTSALGLLMSDVKHHYTRSHLARLAELEVAQAAQAFDDLDRQALAEMAREGFGVSSVTLRHGLDLRYAGQGYELRVSLQPGPISRSTLDDARHAFDALHERLHGHRADTAPVELVSYSTAAVAAVPQAATQPASLAADSDAPPARGGERRAWFPSGGWQSTPIYLRERLVPGHELVGPAIVQHLDSTTVVHPDQKLRVDQLGNLIVRWAAAEISAETEEHA